MDWDTDTWFAPTCTCSPTFHSSSLNRANSPVSLRRETIAALLRKRSSDALAAQPAKKQRTSGSFVSPAAPPPTKVDAELDHSGLAKLETASFTDVVVTLKVSMDIIRTWKVPKEIISRSGLLARAARRLDRTKMDGRGRDLPKIRLRLVNEDYLVLVEALFVFLYANRLTSTVANRLGDSFQSFVRLERVAIRFEVPGLLDLAQALLRDLCVKTSRKQMTYLTPGSNPNENHDVTDFCLAVRLAYGEDIEVEEDKEDEEDEEEEEVEEVEEDEEQEEDEEVEEVEEVEEEEEVDEEEEVEEDEEDEEEEEEVDRGSKKMKKTKKTKPFSPDSQDLLADFAFATRHTLSTSHEFEAVIQEIPGFATLLIRLLLGFDEPEFNPFADAKVQCGIPVRHRRKETLGVDRCTECERVFGGKKGVTKGMWNAMTLMAYPTQVWCVGCCEKAGLAEGEEA